jgi:hypothetical protein
MSHDDDHEIHLLYFLMTQESRHDSFFMCDVSCYPRYLGITRRSCLEAHMVLDMEYREQE